MSIQPLAWSGVRLGIAASSLMHVGATAKSLPTTVNTSIANVSSFDDRPRQLHQEAWARFVNDQLIELGKDPARFIDDESGEIAPTSIAVDTAVALAYLLRDKGRSPADSIEPDGVGGIALKRKSKDGTVERFVISATGEIQFSAHPPFKDATGQIICS